MKALRRSIKGEKQENRPQHISIAPKSDYAISAFKKLVVSKAAWDPRAQNEINIAPDEMNKYLRFGPDQYFSVVREINDRGVYEVWGKDNSGEHCEGWVPMSYFNEVPKQRRSGGSSLMGTPALPDSGYSTAQSYGRSDSALTPRTPKHGRMSSMTRGAMVYGVVQYDFNAERPDELEAKAGEAIIVIAQSNPEWFVAKPIGRLGGPGLIPVSFIEVKDMATGLPVPDPQKAVQAAGVPKVEEWKRLAAEYKNTSIPLGQLTVPTPGGGVSPGAVTQGMAGMSLNNGGQQYSPETQNQSPPYQYQPQPQQRQPQSLLAPITASIPRYCFENDKYWYIIECKMEDGTHWELSRFYQNFYDFQIKLLQQFPDEAATNGGTRILPFMPGPVTYVTDAISNGRRESLDEYVKRLLALPPHISRCQLVRELFAPREGDFELDPKAMQEDYRLSSTSQQSGSVQHTHYLSREPSSQPGDDNPYASQTRSNPWQSQQDYGNYTSYTPDTSYSNNNYYGSNFGDPSGSSSALGQSDVQVKIKVFFEDDCVKFRVSRNIPYDQLVDKVRNKLKLLTQPIQIDYEDEGSGKLIPLSNDERLGTAMRTIKNSRELHLYVGVN